MLFGKIDYINLAPFHVFLKRYIKSNQLKQSIEYKKSYPSHINTLFKNGKIDAAFISSIESRGGNFTCYDIGIVAKDEIQSVLVKTGTYKKDSESATSNALAKVLGIDGEVIIGDKALKLFCSDSYCYIDLASQWYKKTKKPFVFARFCVLRNRVFYKKMINRFIREKVKIPRYILAKYSKKSGVSQRDIISYLKLVSYNIDYKSKKGLKLFLRKSK